jgi:hypothetical protein
MKAQVSQWATVALAFAVVLFVAALMPPVEAAPLDEPLASKRIIKCHRYRWACLPVKEDAGMDEPLQWKCHWIKRGVRSCKR